MNKLIKQSIERLNTRLGRPDTGSSVKRGKYSAHIGHLFADHNTIYGGYRLTEISNAGGGQSGFNDGGTSARMSCKEFKLYLQGIHDALDVKKWRI